MLQRLTTLASQAANGTYNSVARQNLQSEVDELMAEIDRIANYTDFNGIKPLAHGAATNAGAMTFQIGPSQGETLKLLGSDMTVSQIFSGAPSSIKKGSTSINIDGGKLTDKANSAISAISEAINKVSSYRAKLGAAQNRLEHTINNLKVTSENITAAESRIRDTDMADEITSFTKNNILLQASQSMLAQSNSVPQSVLSLLS